MEWDESKHPRDRSGKFTDGSDYKYPQYLARVNGREGRQKKKNTVLLEKKEYAELCSAVRTKYADKVPRDGQILYGKYFYCFHYTKSQEQIVCTFRLQIENNEEEIEYLMRGKHGKS